MLQASRDVYGRHPLELTPAQLGYLPTFVAARMLENEEVKRRMGEDS